MNSILKHLKKFPDMQFSIMIASNYREVVVRAREKINLKVFELERSFEIKGSTDEIIIQNLEEMAREIYDSTLQLRKFG